jgi:hypothetical protein
LQSQFAVAVRIDADFATGDLALADDFARVFV